MPEKLFWLTALLALLFESAAEMASENYCIPSSVHSAGGNPTGSANYQINGTVGQPSPLMAALEPPLSDAYDLYPGFWHGIAAWKSPAPVILTAIRISMAQIYRNIYLTSGGLSVDVFAVDFGKADCP